MKKTLPIIIIVAVVLFAAYFLLSSSSQASFESLPPEVPGEVIYIPYPVKITLDGNLGDWENVPTSTVDTGPMLSGDPAENGSFSFAVAADMDNFYITMQMPDKKIVKGMHGENYWNEDSMEFYINATDDLNAKKYDIGSFQVNINATDIGNTDADTLTITGVFSGDANARGFVFKTDDGWGFEAAVPLQGLLEVSHGKEIGFQAQINGATELDRDVKLIWSKADTTDKSWETPQVFGRAIFFDLGESDVPQPSLVILPPTPVPTPGPVIIPTMVSVNQVGYFPSGQKLASVPLNTADPTEWKLLDTNGESVLSGETTVIGQEALWGQSIHWVDFSKHTTPGEKYKLIVGDLESVPFSISTEIYTQLKTDALSYFYHSRSGTPIEAAYVGEKWARPAGHISDEKVTCFKGEDADENVWPGCDYSLDVTGGWYDAGDFGKYVVNGGISVWTLMNLYERFPETFVDGSLQIPENTNGTSDLLDEARWEMDFLLSMQVPEGEPQAGMAHHKMHDLAWEPLPMVPPALVNNDGQHRLEEEGRYLYPPSTASTLNLAATAAQCARIWTEIDPDFAEQCLTAAEIAWDAAQDNPGIYAGDTPGQGGGNYDDRSLHDEFHWAAAELFITTGKDEYKEAALETGRFGLVSSFDWGHTAPLGNITLLMYADALPEDDRIELEASFLAFADKLLDIQSKRAYPYILEEDFIWGSNGQILNNMIIIGHAFDISGDAKYLDAMRTSMDYILGRNPLDRSYVSGYGAYPIQHPHHRFWANDPANGYPPPPPGAVAGGPNATPTDQAAIDAELENLPPAKRYIDDVESYSTNEVTINWNAPLAWVATYLDQVSE